MDAAGQDILDRLGAALDRSRPEQLESRTLLAAKKKAQAQAPAHSLPSLSPDASPHRVSVDGLQQHSPSPPPVIGPFNLAADEGWGPSVAATSKRSMLREPSPDLRSHMDPRHASVDITPNRSIDPLESPQKSGLKSIHALRAEAHRESLTPGTLAAQMPQACRESGADVSSLSLEADTPSRPARARDNTLSNTPRKESPPQQLIIDEIPASAPAFDMQEIDELTMETLVLAENQAVQHVVVAGCGRQYMACLVTLRVEHGDRLAPAAREFAAMNGSNALTVEDAKTCSAFHTAMLKGFAACNKKVWEASRRTSFSNVNCKPAQLRRYTILPELFTPIDETLRTDGTVDRTRVLDLYAEVIESMYGAATTGTEDSVCVTPMHPSVGGGRIESSLTNAVSPLWPVQVRYQCDRREFSQLAGSNGLLCLVFFNF